jgi:PTS system N-acetylglucosamine-specific IIC component
MSGFFPVMMFGLPAACLAMYHTALPARKRAAGGLLLSLALTSFLTGVTEPIEFTFMFLAPALYALHAVLTGAAMVTMDLLQSRMGFSFSAGLFDYVLNFGKSTRPLLLFPVGLAYFALYYGLFRYFIVRFDLRTPGREREEAVAAAFAPAVAGGDDIDALIAALGGASNLESVDACTTRLRLVMRDRRLARVDELRRLGASGSVAVGERGLQVVLGPVADQVAGRMRERLAHPGRSREIPAADWIEALGGAANVLTIESLAGRVVVSVKESREVDAGRLATLCERGVATPSPSTVHLLHEAADALAQRLTAAGRD